MTFYPGQKVECIENEFLGWTISGKPYRYAWRRSLSIGARYTVLQVCRPRNPRNPPGLILREIPATPGRCGFPSALFRPLYEDKTDISALEKILRGEEISA